jgi:hypothetical protein
LWRYWRKCILLEAEVADRRGLGFIGWAFGAVTATVIVISGMVVTASVLQPDTAASVTFSAAAR